MLADPRSEPKLVRPERPFEIPLARFSKSLVKLPSFWPKVAVSKPRRSCSVPKSAIPGENAGRAPIRDHREARIGGVRLPFDSPRIAMQPLVSER